MSALGDIPARFVELEEEAAYENAGREPSCEVCGCGDLLPGYVVCSECHADITDGSDVSPHVAREDAAIEAARRAVLDLATGRRGAA